MNNQVKDNTKSFDHYRRMIGLIGGPLLAILVFLTPIAGINMAAHKLLAIWCLFHVGGLQNQFQSLLLHL